MGGQVIVLAPEQALNVWDRLGPLLEAALEHDVWCALTIEDVKEQVATAQAIVLLAGDESGKICSATVLQLHTTRTGERILYVLGTAGSDMDAWLGALVSKLHELAELYACAAVHFNGRLGWIRPLRKYGFRATSVEMRMEVEDGRQIEVEPAQHAAEFFQ